MKDKNSPEQDKSSPTDKNSRFQKYEARQKLKKDREVAAIEKLGRVIGWSVERNEEIRSETEQQNEKPK